MRTKVKQGEGEQEKMVGRPLGMQSRVLTGFPCRARQEVKGQQARVPGKRGACDQEGKGFALLGLEASAGLVRKGLKLGVSAGKSRPSGSSRDAFFVKTQ